MRWKWKEEQMNDKDISCVIGLLEGKEVDKTSVSRNVKIMLWRKNKFVLHNQLLYRKALSITHETEYFQFVLPIGYRKQALEACHNEVGHLGIEKKAIC